MDTIKQLLSKRDPSIPKEVGLIKTYVQEKFKSDVVVLVQPTQIIISAANAALAGTLRLCSHDLAEICQTDKRIVIRIGS